MNNVSQWGSRFFIYGRQMSLQVTSHYSMIVQCPRLFTYLDTIQPELFPPRQHLVNMFFPSDLDFFLLFLLQQYICNILTLTFFFFLLRLCCDVVVYHVSSVSNGYGE